MLKNKKVKLASDHRKIINQIAKQLEMTRQETTEILLEKSFVFLKMLAEQDETKFVSVFKLYQSKVMNNGDNPSKQLVELVDQWWKAGALQEEEEN